MKTGNISKIKKLSLNIFATCVVTIVLEFTFKYSEGLFVSLFTGTSKDVVKNVKIIVLASYLVSLIALGIPEKREYNLWSALLYKIISAAIITFGMIKWYIWLIGYEILILDILILISSSIISNIIESVIQDNFRVSAKIEEIYKYLNILLAILSGIYILI